MDPRANIKEQRELARDLLNGTDNDPMGAAERLAELVVALDEWRTNGGFDPYKGGPTRYARITARVYMDEHVIASYLPANYEVIGKDSDGAYYIAGTDNAGWTLDEYVLPRLESGLYFGEEIK